MNRTDRGDFLAVPNDLEMQQMLNSFQNADIQGAGLGLRRDFLGQAVTRLQAGNPLEVDFFEIAPENWLKFGGEQGKQLATLTEAYPFVCHGLSLDIGGRDPLKVDYLKSLKVFFDQHDVRLYTEHLSYCGNGGLLYDLMPIPFTGEAVHYVADRIRQIQDILERPIGIENVSFYAMPTNELTESEFVNAVVEEADCGLLLDVNNCFVNGINHQYDPLEFIKSMPTQRIMYMHQAGHFDEAEDLKIDTHGQDVKPAVWALLAQTYEFHGIQPTLLERDFNIPPLDELMEEFSIVREHQKSAQLRQAS